MEVNLFIEIKEDIFFNRQLRIPRHVPTYKKCNEESHRPIEDAFMKLWSNTIGLEEETYLSKMVLNLTIENFYLRITKDSINREWLLEYLKEIVYLVKSMKK